jgi:predicted Zn-dependent peptidase
MIRKTVLDNGLRIITEAIPHLYSVSVGIWVDNGSRDEGSRENGLSHFIEHMIFKGTRSRSALQIAKELDAIGGLSNAFTSKEQTCFHAKVLDTHLGQAVEILLDIFLHSLFDPEELERERQVVLQEICMVEDTPDEYVHVLFSQLVHQGNALAQPILGTPETVQSFTQGKILDYLKEAYGSGKIIVAAAGNVEHQAFVDLVAPELKGRTAEGQPNTRQEPGLTSRSWVVSKDLEQVHLALGTWAPSVSDPRRYAGNLLNVILGGNMSSRLFQEVREKRGLAYSIYSFLAPYQNTGLWGIYTAIAKETLTETLEVIGQELTKIKKGNLPTAELEAAKEFVKGGLLLSAESTDNRMSRLAKNEFDFGRHLSFEEILESVNRVTVSEVVDLAQEILRPGLLSLTALGPLTETDLPSPFLPLE